MHIKESYLKHLANIDKVQKRLIEKYDKPQLSKSEDFILDLCKYIIFQQISTKAGNSIYKRFTKFYYLNKNNLNTDEFKQLSDELYNINNKLWEIEDNIRDKERLSDFGEEFVKLARDVYFTNDKRSEIKKKINILAGSKIIEEKSYSDY